MDNNAAKDAENSMRRAFGFETEEEQKKRLAEEKKKQDEEHAKKSSSAVSRLLYEKGPGAAVRALFGK